MEKEIILNRPNFLDSEVGLKTKTYTFSKSYAVADGIDSSNGRKVIKAGAPIPTNDESCIGLAFQDIDITDGDKAGAIMEGGYYLEDALPVTLDEGAKSALAARGLFARKKSVDVFPSDGNMTEKN